MDALREQFEAWLKKEHPSVASGFNDFADYEEDLAWQACKFGHAANTVNADLLEALEESLALNINWSETASDEDLMHLSEYKQVIKQALAAIKKARGE